MKVSDLVKDDCIKYYYVPTGEGPLYGKITRITEWLNYHHIYLDDAGYISTGAESYLIFRVSEEEYLASEIICA